MLQMASVESRGPGELPAAARDLVDFHLRWPEFRPTALGLLSVAGLSAAQSETLGWLIELADRIGVQDLSRN